MAENNEVVRLDLMYSQAIEVDILAEFEKYGVGRKYTRFSDVVGTGEHDPKMGDPIWPQLNNSMLIYCSEEESQILARIVKDLRLRFPMEGIACFKSIAQVL